MLCPICKKSLPDPVTGEQRPPHFPFCSERCRLIDLGRWLDGKYQINKAEIPERDREPRDSGQE